jgi:hypothetical protein
MSGSHNLAPRQQTIVASSSQAYWRTQVRRSADVGSVHS